MYIQKKKTIFFKCMTFIMVLCSLASLNGCANKKYISYDFETYLSEDTDFCQNATTVMPSREELSDSKIIYFFYYVADSLFTSPSSSIYLTVEYSDEKFKNEAQRLEQLYEKHCDDLFTSQYYLNGVFFRGVEFEYECALSYHICSESNVITYIVFQCKEMQFMEVKHALNYCLPTDCNYLIVSYQND